MNSHRYFFYLASLLLLINTYDAVLAFFPPGGFGFGLGSIILVVNVAAAVGLHARLPRLPAHRRRQAQALLAQPAALRDVEPHLDWLNARHMQFAWASLVSVTLTDVYIMAVSAGWISDLRIVG